MEKVLKYFFFNWSFPKLACIILHFQKQWNGASPLSVDFVHISRLFVLDEFCINSPHIFDPFILMWWLWSLSQQKPFSIMIINFPLQILIQTNQPSGSKNQNLSSPCSIFIFYWFCSYIYIYFFIILNWRYLNYISLFKVHWNLIFQSRSLYLNLVFIWDLLFLIKSLGCPISGCKKKPSLLPFIYDHFIPKLRNLMHCFL